MLPFALTLLVTLLAQSPPPPAVEPAPAPTSAPAPAPAPAPEPAPTPATVNLASVVANPPANAEAQATLEAPFRAAIPQIERCYADQRGRASESVGDLLVQTAYGKKGELLSLSVLSAGVLDDTLRACAREAVSAALGAGATGPKKGQLSASYELRQPRP